MPSRQVHTVRLISPDDPNPSAPTLYLDVEVVDAIDLIAPNGQGIYLDMTSPDPQVTDNTGDGSERASGSPTRISHMERLTNPDDATNFFDAEILDGFTFMGPNGQGTFYDTSNNNAYQIGDPDSSPPFTRSGTVTTFTDPRDSSNVLSVLSTDTITAGGAAGDEPPARYGQIALNFNDGDKIDPTDSAANPPVNADPNPYLKLLTGGGPWLGNNKVVKQGPLWKIVNVVWNKNPEVFFIYYVALRYIEGHSQTITKTINNFVGITGENKLIIDGADPTSSDIWGSGAPVSDNFVDMISYSGWYGDGSARTSWMGQITGEEGNNEVLLVDGFFVMNLTKLVATYSGLTEIKFDAVTFLPVHVSANSSYWGAILGGNVLSDTPPGGSRMGMVVTFSEPPPPPSNTGTYNLGDIASGDDPGDPAGLGDVHGAAGIIGPFSDTDHSGTDRVTITLDLTNLADSTFSIESF